MAKDVFNFIDSSSSLERKRVNSESSEDLDLCIICQTTGDIDRVIESVMSGSLTLLWRRKCFSDFTHKGKVERLQKSLQQTSCSSSVSHFGEKHLASRRTSRQGYVKIEGPCQI